MSSTLHDAVHFKIDFLVFKLMKSDREVIRVSQEPVGGQKMPLLFYLTKLMLILLPKDILCK